MPDELGRILETVRDRVAPSEEEREQLKSVANRAIERTEAAIAELRVEADVLQVGSTARATWLRGDRDIDIFVRFPSDLDREELEEFGLAVGHEVLPEGRLEYAEHPYVTGEIEGYDIDLVPCFGVERASDIRSAVDRTPFHAAYIEDVLSDRLATDVRVLKRFCEAIGIYGSDLRTQGFSGYLTELLVIHYGGFTPVIEAAADWEPPVRIDPEDHGTESFADPLVVIDPTDPGRNVAAVVTAETVARFQHHARELLADPRLERFDVPEQESLERASLRRHLNRRQTTPIAVRVPAPDVVDDQLFPQLRRSREGIVDALEAADFRVLRSASFVGDDVILYFDLAVAELPAVERHEGPPVHVATHAESFLDRWNDESDAYGPFIDGDRYVVERPRQHTAAADMLGGEALLEARLGADLREPLAMDRQILVGEEVLDLVPEFGTDLASFYEPSP